MQRKFFAPAVAAALLAAGLSIGKLAAQQGLPPNLVQPGGNISPATSTSIAVASTTPSAPVYVGSPTSHGSAIAGLPDLAKLQAEMSWGMKTLPLPKYLRHPELGLSPNQGLLVTELVPGLMAASAGIEPGSLLIEIDGTPLLDNQPLPILNAEHKLMVLGESGLRELLIKPHPEIAGQSLNFDPLDGQANVFAQMMPQLGLHLRGFPHALAQTSNQPAPRSLSVSEVNGEINLVAIVDGTSGPVRVQLQGCKTKIAEQLGKLPAEIQAQLAPHVGL